MARKTLYLMAILLGIAFLFPSSLHAQQVAVAEVTGLVSDATGAVVPGATVKMVETDKSVTRTATTDAGGNYVLPGLPPGPYRLEVSKTGFKTYVLSNVVLQVNDHATLNATLQVGAANETVEVSGGAALVHTETAEISNVIESKSIVDLPLNGRYATQLVLLSGASLNAPGGDEMGSKNFYSSQTISVAGGQANGTNYLLDGGDNNDTFSNVNLPFPFPEALQEFSVETSALPARNGLHPGGVVNLVTKSGSNVLHGDAFEFYRDGVFNARARQFTPTPPKADTLLRNQFGGTLGGKLISDELFWFAGYQGTRARAASSASTHTYTQATLNGDFTAMESPSCTGLSSQKTLGGQFAGTDTVDPSQYDAAAVKLLTYIPISTDPCGSLTYQVPSIDNENQIIGRVDYIRSPKQSIYGRYFIDDFTAPPPFDITNLLTTTTPGNWERSQSFTLGHTHTFSPSLINSFHFTFNRRRDNRAPDPKDLNPGTLGINMYSAVPDFFLISSISGHFGVGCGTCAPGFFNVNTIQEADDVDRIFGKHHLAFGGEFIRTQNNTLTGYDENGTFGFNGTFTGDGLADFLVGEYNGFAQSHPQQVTYRESIPSLYAQDTYKATSRLTVTAGLRWEPTIQPADHFHRGSIFNMQDFLNNVRTGVYTSNACPGISCPPAGVLYYGDPGVSAAFTNNHLANFAPRIGLAWDPTGHGTQSFRTGYGIFYDSTMTWFSQRLASNPPFVDEVDNTAGCGTLSNPWLNYSSATGCGAPNANENPFPGGSTIFPNGSLYVSLPPNMRPMYMMQWNLSYERQFFKQWSFSFAYLGNRSLHLPLSYDANYIETSPSVCTQFGTTGCSTKNEQQRRFLYQAAGGFPAANTAAQNPAAIGSLFYALDSGYSNYHALLATIQHRFSNGFSVNANYTFSRCLSLGDFNGDLRGTYFMNQQDPRADYGNCNFDIRHIFNASAVAISPFHGHGAIKWLLGGWQFAPSFRATTGWPLNVVIGSDALAAGNEGGDRPELVPGQPLYINKWVSCGTNVCYQVFNPAAFVSPTSSSGPTAINPKLGNSYAYAPVARDALYSPGLFNFDAALSRMFPVRERFQWEFRFEVFNVLDHFNPDLATIGNTQGLNSSSFGRVTGAPGAGFVPSAYDPRILQLAMKLHF